MFTHESKSVPAYNFNCLIETEELLKVTDSHIHCESSII